MQRTGQCSHSAHLYKTDISFRSGTEFGIVGYVPESCCTELTPGCGSEAGQGGDRVDLHQAGCLDALQREVSENIEIVLGAIAGVVVIQVIILMIWILPIILFYHLFLVSKSVLLELAIYNKVVPMLCNLKLYVDTIYRYWVCV